MKRKNFAGHIKIMTFYSHNDNCRSSVLLTLGHRTYLKISSHSRNVLYFQIRYTSLYFPPDLLVRKANSATVAFMLT